jgi:DNA-binding NarL/FixJ family response regulator
MKQVMEGAGLIAIVAEPVRIALVVNDALVRVGLRMLVESDGGCRVVRETGTISDVAALVDLDRPDVILLDLDTADGTVVRTLEAFLEGSPDPRPRVLALSRATSADLDRSTIRNRLRGVVGKGEPPEVLFRAIRKVHRGEVWREHGLGGPPVPGRRDAAAASCCPEASHIASLTPRQREVIRLVARGLRNKQIASRLLITTTTVRHHLTAIFSKLNVPDRLSLVIYAFRHNLASHDF